MRTIIRRIPAKIVRSYQCRVCHNVYKNKEDAKKCEARILERQEFKKDDLVRNVEQRFCNHKPYIFDGKVVEVFGPVPSDYDYEVRHLGGKRERLNGHIFRYLARYTCPRCLKTKEAMYYGPELRKKEK